MTLAEYGAWLTAAFEFLPLPESPCSDCTIEFAAEQRTLGYRDGEPARGARTPARGRVRG